MCNKLFTSIFILCLGLSVQAQAPVKGTSISKAFDPRATQVDLEQPAFYKYHPANATAASGTSTDGVRGGIEYIPLGTAYNLFTILLDGQNQVSYQPDVNSLTFIHRQNNGTAGGSGGLSFDVSTDGGATWNTNLIITPDYNAGIEVPDVSGNRYPSAAIYNPPGNTNPDLAFIVANGPALDPLSATASWGSTFRISATLDGNNIDEQYYQTPGEPYDFHPYGIQAYGSGSLWSISTTYNNTGDVANDILTYEKYRVNEITPDIPSMSFAYNTTDLIPDFYTYTPTGGAEENMAGYGWNIYFDPSGTTGYIVILGALSTDAIKAVQPIVYKTTDAGATWNLLPDFDFGSLTMFQDWTIPTWDGQYIPFFTSFDGAVDNEGTLHLFGEYISRSTSSTEPDSLYFIWNGFNGFAHLTTSDGSDWTSTLIGYSQLTDATYGTVAVPYRVQVSSTPDGSKIFFTRTMSDSLTFTEHAAPDLLVVGYDIASGEYTNEINVTEGTDYGYAIYFATTSPVSMDNGAGQYEIPVVFALPGADENAPPQFYYIKGITIEDSDFGAEPAAVANFSFSVLTGGNVSFSNSSVNATTYSWDFGDGSGTSPLFSPTYTYAENGTYEVCLTASNATSSDTNCKDVTVNNVGGSILDENNVMVLVYPQPASQQLMVQFGDEQPNTSISISNLLGEVVHPAVQVNSSVVMLEINDLPAGQYLLKIQSDKGAFVKQISIAH